METIFNHKSIRKYLPLEIEPAKMQKMLEAAVRGSNTGNMQLYSIVLTREQQAKEALSPCHFRQAMVTQAPLVATFCADINRFSKWCSRRDAEPGFDNFLWFVTAAIDTVIAAQNFCLEAESLGLGACYLGTTTYNAGEISRVLSLPKGVVPVTTLVVGYPDESPALTDRLPLEAVVHYETYKDYTSDAIEALYKAKEELPETLRLLQENQLDNLAKIFTQRRYKAQDSLVFSRKFYETLNKQGFI